MEQQSSAFETEDLALAAFLKMKGIEMLDYERNRDKVLFTFDDDNSICKKFHIEFLNSDCKRFDSEVRDLKKLFKRK